MYTNICQCQYVRGPSLDLAIVWNGIIIIIIYYMYHHRHCDVSTNLGINENSKETRKKIGRQFLTAHSNRPQNIQP